MNDFNALLDHLKDQLPLSQVTLTFDPTDGKLLGVHLGRAQTEPGPQSRELPPPS